MSMVNDIKELSPGEITFLIENIAAMKPVDELQEIFLIFTGGLKRISGSTIQQIQLRYSDRIKKQNEAYLINVSGCPLAHPRIRLDICYKILRDALKERPSNSVRTGEDSFELILKCDNTTALNALKLAMQEMVEIKKLELLEDKKESDKGTENIEDEWDMKDGLRVV